MRGRRIAAVAALGSLVHGAAAMAVIWHPVDDAVVVSHPLDAVVGKFSGASAVAIDPNHFIASRHQDSVNHTGGSATVVFGGVTYKIVQDTFIGNVDLRVARITKMDGSPANLTAYTPIFTGNDNLTQDFTMGGFGRTRGTSLTTTGGTYGYNWSAGNSSTVQWGNNHIDSGQTVSASGFTSNTLGADFDAAFGSSWREAIMASGDSGGGWFVLNGSQWQVRAMSAYLNHNATNSGQPSTEALFASYQNANIAAPDLLYGIRVASYSAEIQAAVPEPSSLSLLALGGLLLSWRGRRQARH